MLPGLFVCGVFDGHGRTMGAETAERAARHIPSMFRRALLQLRSLETSEIAQGDIIRRESSATEAQAVKIRLSTLEIDHPETIVEEPVSETKNTSVLFFSLSPFLFVFCLFLFSFSL